MKAAMKAMMRVETATMMMAADAAVPIAVQRVKLFCLRSQFCILASDLGSYKVYYEVGACRMGFSGRYFGGRLVRVISSGGWMPGGCLRERVDRRLLVLAGTWFSPVGYRSIPAWRAVPGAFHVVDARSAWVVTPRLPAWPR